MRLNCIADFQFRFKIINISIQIFNYDCKLLLIFKKYILCKNSVVQGYYASNSLEENKLDIEYLFPKKMFLYALEDTATSQQRSPSNTGSGKKRFREGKAHAQWKRLERQASLLSLAKDAQLISCSGSLRLLSMQSAHF